MKYLANWQLFVARAYKRLKQGALEYGDKSFSKDPLLLLDEIEEELLDVVNWTFILLQRIQKVKKAYARANLERYEKQLDERLAEEGEEGS